MSGKLPYDYEVEYLEADGTQYVDTGVAVVGGSPIPDVEVDFEPVGDPSVNNSSSDIAGYTDFSVGTGFTSKYPYPARKFRVFSEAYYGDDVVYEARHVAGLKTEDGVLTKYFDDEKWTYSASSTSLTYVHASFGLFCCGSATDRNGGKVDPKPNKNRTRIYSASCDGHKFVPVVKDGEACFYDTATAGLLRSQGAPFIAGPRKTSPKTFFLGMKTEIKPKTPYIETRGADDSFWAATADALGCIVGETAEVGCKTDFSFLTEYTTDEHPAYSLFGMQFGFYSYWVAYTNSGTGNTNNKFYIGHRPGAVLNDSNAYVVPPSDYQKRHVVIEDGRLFTVNGDTIAEYLDPPSMKLTSGKHFVLGGYYNGSTPPLSVSSPSRARFYGFSFHQNGNLVFDLVPHKDGESVGMKDRVSGKFFPGNNLIYGEE